MNRPLRPGAKWRNWEVRQVLAWGRQGGVYRVVQPERQAIVKTLRLPPLSPESLESRRQQLNHALDRWTRLRSPLAARLLERQESDEEWVLCFEEVCGLPLTQVEFIELNQPLEDCLREVVELARELEGTGLPLFSPDHWMVSEGGLQLVNPGWSELLWGSGSPPEFLDELRCFGNWLTLLSQRLSQPTSLTWLLSRCTHPDPARCYSSYEAIEAGLKEIHVQTPPPALRGQSGPGEVDLGELPPPAPSRPLPMRWQLVILGLACSLILLVWGVRRQQRGLELWRGDGLYLFRERSLLKLNLQGKVMAERPLTSAPRCQVAGYDGRLFVGLQGQSQLQIFDRGRSRRLGLPGEPQTLLLHPDGTLLVQLTTGLLVRVALHGRRETVLDRHSSGDGRLLDAAAGGWLMEGQDAIELWRGFPPSRVASFSLSPPGWAIGMGPWIVCSSVAGQSLSLLDEELVAVREQRLSRRPQALIRNPYERKCWTYDQREISCWTLPELAEESSWSLAAPVQCHCADAQGQMWLLNTAGELWRWESQKGLNKVSEPGGGLAIVYLADEP